MKINSLELIHKTTENPNIGYATTFRFKRSPYVSILEGDFIVLDNGIQCVVIDGVIAYEKGEWITINPLFILTEKEISGVLKCKEFGFDLISPYEYQKESDDKYKLISYRFKEKFSLVDKELFTYEITLNKPIEPLAYEAITKGLNEFKK